MIDRLHVHFLLLACFQGSVHVGTLPTVKMFTHRQKKVRVSKIDFDEVISKNVKAVLAPDVSFYNCLQF